MKVIDLLNKIANGKIPKKIVYNDRQWFYDEILDDYRANDYSRIDWKYTVWGYLNDKVEVIEEDNKIEEIDMFDYFTGYDYGGTDKKLLKDLEHNFETLNSKINEIIDCINKE